MKCPVVSLGLSTGLAWLWEVHLLMFSIVFLFCWIISMVCLALDLVGSWVELGVLVGGVGVLLSECNVSSSEF